MPVLISGIGKGTGQTERPIRQWQVPRARQPTPEEERAGLLAVAWPLPEFLAARHTLGLPDTRHLARKWINANIPVDRPMAVELYGPIFQPDERTMLIWPFFATQVPLVRPAYHPEFLDGLDYYVLSHEVTRRFDADSASYPVESAYYRWIRAHTTVAWKSEAGSSSGPAIEIRQVPAGISTAARRDSLFAAAMPAPSGISRVALWCFDYANLFGRLGRYGISVRSMTRTFGGTSAEFTFVSMRCFSSEPCSLRAVSSSLFKRS